MKRTMLRFFFLVVVSFGLVACSHSIVIDPPVATGTYGDRVPISVGVYVDKSTLNHIYQDDLFMGENVRFSTGETIRDYSLKTFSLIFNKVVLVDTKDLTNFPGLIAVLEPEILELRSTDLDWLLWYPLGAVATIKCTIFDIDGKQVGLATATGKSKHERVAWDADRPAKAYERALQNAMEDLVQKLRAAPWDSLPRIRKEPLAREK